MHLVFPYTASMPLSIGVRVCLKQMLCATLQNSRKKYNSDSEKPAPWTWFKSNPNNPYKV